MDEIEQRVMQDGSAVRFREKIAATGPAATLIAFGGLLALGGIVGGVVTGSPLSAGIGGALGIAVGGLIAGLGIAGAVARTVVTEKAVHLQAGPRFFVIPLHSVHSTEVGQRRGWYRKTYDLSILPIASTTLTLVHEVGGETRRTTVSTRDAEGLMRAIGRTAARARVETASGAVRDGLDVDDTQEEDGEQERIEPRRRARPR